MWLPHSALAVWPLSISGGPVGFAVKLASRPSPSRSLFYLGLVASAVGRMLCAKVVRFGFVVRPSSCRFGFFCCCCPRLASLRFSVGSAGFFPVAAGSFGQVVVWRFRVGGVWVVLWLNRANRALACFSLPKSASVGKVRFKAFVGGAPLTVTLGNQILETSHE